MRLAYRYFTLNPLKEVRFSLQKIIGLGFRKAFFICAKAGLCFPFAICNINFYFFSILIFLIKFFAKSPITVRRLHSVKANAFLNVGHLRAIKFFDFLPVNGQRSRSNCGVRRRLKIAHYALMEARRKMAEEAKKRKEKKEKKEREEKKKEKKL